MQSTLLACTNTTCTKGKPIRLVELDIKHMTYTGVMLVPPCLCGQPFQQPTNEEGWREMLTIIIDRVLVPIAPTLTLPQYEMHRMALYLAVSESADDPSEESAIAFFKKCIKVREIFGT